MAFTALSWKHLLETFKDVDKAFDSAVDMITGKKSSPDTEDEEQNEESQKGGFFSRRRKRRSEARDDEDDGSSNSKKSSLEEDSSKESENRAAVRFLSSLTNVISKPAQFLKKSLANKGIDSWVPSDPEQIAEIPDELIEKYRKIHPNVEAPKKYQLVNGDFSVLIGDENMKKEESAEKEEKTTEEKLTNSELNKKEKIEPNNNEKDAKKPLHHLAITLYNENDKRYVMSLFRSNNVSDVVGLCERCRENPELFRVFPSDVDIKEYINLIFNELRENMTWKSVHISAKIGLIEYFRNLKPEKLTKTFTMIAQPEGLTPLLIAIQNDKKEIVEFLLKNGADLNIVCSDGSNVLHIAATSSVDMIKFLWETKQCATMLNKSDSQGHSPMYIALTNGYLSNARYLNGLGASITANDATHEATPLLGAIKRGKLDEQTLKKILEMKPDALDEKEATTGNTTLHCAINKKTVILLIEKYGETVDKGAENLHKQTPLHSYVIKEDIGLVMTICAYNVDINAQDCNGNTPLHFAVTKGNIDIARQLLCLGADPNKINHYRETPRHIAARFPIREKALDLVRSLIICGAKTCGKEFVGCAFGCMDREGLETCRAHASGKDLSKTIDEKVNNINVDAGATSAPYEFELDADTHLVDKAYAEKNEIRMYPHTLAIERVKKRLEDIVKRKDSSNVVNVLSLDGGGIRGLVTVQVLLALEKYLDSPLINYFDWIGATSTGSYIMSTLLVGDDLRTAQKYYLQFKDQLFDSWSRPYDAIALEKLMKKCFGEERKLSDVQYPKMFCTTVRADTFPVQLDLCRNYRLPISEKENDDLGFQDPTELTLWKACRRSSAAPTYFPASEGKYIDGGMISNNPTLDLMSEICFWNTTCQKSGNESKMVDIGCLLSVGTGVTPVCPVDPSYFEMNDFMGLLRGIRNLSLVVIDQATATEGAHITRSRSWCHSLGIPYFRFNSPLFKDIILDTTDDTDLAKIMWDSVVYSHTHRKDFEEVAGLLKLIGTTEERKKLLNK